MIRARTPEAKAMPATKILRMNAEIDVVVFDSLEQITTYVLEEQQDWFEDEIRAVRKLLKPGQTVLDIGANLGVYSLSMAKVVSDTGRVIAFEPASKTATLLKQSARLNGFNHLEVDDRGVGALSGEAILSLNSLPELNQILEQPAAEIDDSLDSELIKLTSLDEWASSQANLDTISFIKLDAEGQEINVIAGAHQLLSTHSPLILYEVKHGTTMHLELVDAFEKIGYSSYRLIPGPLLLTAFDRNTADNFLLNLFCCNEETAQRLERDGFLARQTPSDSPLITTEFYDWQLGLEKFPYAIQLGTAWLEHCHGRPPDPVHKALTLHALSNNQEERPSTRIQALEQCVEILKEACTTYRGPIHLASLARGALALGQRDLAGEALRSLIGAIPHMNSDDFQEPFLSPCSRFDAIDPSDSLQAWLMAAALEAHEINSSFSSFFNGSPNSENLQYALSLGFESPILERRLNLINRRFAPVEKQL